MGEIFKNRLSGTSNRALSGYLRNWNFMRILRLALGIFIVVQGVQASEWRLMLLGGLFSLMPVFSVGCCGNGGCSVPSRPSRDNDEGKSKEIAYEEIR